MKSLLAVFSLSLGLAGCGQKPAPAPAIARPPTAAVSMESQAEAGTPAPPPAAEATSTATPAEHELSLKELTAAVQTYLQVNPDYPKDLNDLVKMKLLKKMPTPPPGKKFVIDRQNICVILADK